ncbi:MAG: site-specific integrase [Candidatus Marinimicrobia bacterium]|jgi:integrase|nr:site-specific integrase [Candidatus Neomarinimicrobiota bacterium]
MAIKTTLTAREINKMISVAKCQRDQLILQFYADTGCRESELLAVTVENIDFDNGTVLIPHLKHGAKKHCPKCNKTAGRSGKWCPHCGANLSLVQAEGVLVRNRIVTIGEETLNLLRDFVQGMEKTDRVINLSRQSVYNIIRKAASDSGLSGKVLVNPETGRKHFIHPHIMRASLAVDWLKIAATDANKQKALQEHLGHQDFGTTMRYNKLSPAQVRKVSDEVRQSRFKEIK